MNEAAAEESSDFPLEGEPVRPFGQALRPAHVSGA
jgi:hypothetical protein